MEDNLWDFSRFYSGINIVKNENSVIFAFNDTFGNGRKLNLPLFYYRKHSVSLTKNQEKILKNRSKIFFKNNTKKKESYCYRVHSN